MNELPDRISILFKTRMDLQQKRESGIRLISAMADYMGHSIDPLADRVLYERSQIDQSIKEIADEIQSIQDACDHQFWYSYSDSKHSYHICQKCNQTDKL